MQEKKPLFLGPDFDRWLDESDAEMELKEKVGNGVEKNLREKIKYLFP